MVKETNDIKKTVKPLRKNGKKPPTITNIVTKDFITHFYKGHDDDIVDKDDDLGKNLIL
jgi:hypothetical protein